ncbi:MAG: MarR family winged helix-turn-helix transcriptional regulator [Erysipelotrichaceae bacterium]|jgi:DNA-binding MarR family transcriptional regulator|nr:MarR family winged helix-turn-helix transcriptional regulator [Erysipelotrichaceae bacterium]
MEKRFEKFTVLTTKIGRNIKKIKNYEMREYQLRSPHISCLYYLYVDAPLTATELSERCEEDKATISRSLSYLEKNGYFTSETKSSKRYKDPLFLTPKGIEMAKRIASKIDAVLSEISHKLSESERTEFYRSLTIISDGLETIGKRLGKSE